MPKWSDHPSTRKGRFWGSKDFEDAQEYTVTIKGYEDIDLPKFNNRDETETTLCLHFKQDDRILAVRTMRGKALSRLFGDEIDKWVGKHITLFGQETGKGLAPMVRKAAFVPNPEGPLGEFGDEDDYPEHFKDPDDEAEETKPTRKATVTTKTSRGKKVTSKVEEPVIEPEEQEIVDEANANLAATHGRVRDQAARKARLDARNAAEQWVDDEDEDEDPVGPEDDDDDDPGVEIAELEAKLAAMKAGKR
jgi:hypothetical protein